MEFILYFRLKSRDGFLQGNDDMNGIDCHLKSNVNREQW